MRKLLFVLALTVCVGVRADEPKKKDKLHGVWQLVEKNKDDGHEMTLPVWKVLEKGGDFSIFYIADNTGRSVLTSKGKYTVKDDSTYVEHVRRSSYDTGDGKAFAVSVSYRFNDKGDMEISYRMPGAAQDGRETWRKVRMH